MGISRETMFAEMGVLQPDIERFVLDAYTQVDMERLAESNQHPRTSFVASKFPGGDDNHCGRHALYSLASPPMVTPTKPSGVAIMGMGVAAEDQIVYRLGRAGRTISGSVPLREYGPIAQLKFEEPSWWISGKLDSVLDLRPRWKSVLPIDVKSKSAAKIAQMRAGELQFDPVHRGQISIYTHLCRKYHSEMGWGEMGLEPAAGGSLVYVSRENPTDMYTFFFPYDRDYVLKGLARLQEWKEMFVADQLPERDRTWRWTEPPCKWCDYKKQCKEDIKADVGRLSDSVVVKTAKQIDPAYDLDRNRGRVVKRWEKKGG